MYKLFLSFITFLVFSFSFSQTRLLKGQVTDSLQKPMEFVNIMAQALNNDNPFVFAVTNEKGFFEMHLQKKTIYAITVSFMGYKPYTFKIDSLEKSGTKKIILRQNEQDLDEIVINYKTPVKITQDSIVYTVKHFIKGNERKLKAVLNKLPGVKVDKNGQITVMGERITKVMVEGKDFFGGNSKLAVENIPANSVKSIQVLKDYNQVSFMKGLTDDQKTVINIKLKEGKKRFVFGDILIGGNTNKNYIAKANLFYFSPKTNLSYIGNINDDGEASLTTQDIRRFENKRDFFMTNISYGDNQMNLYGFTAKDNFISKKTLFNAFQWQQNLGAKWEFEMYTIAANETNDYKKEYDNQFLFEPFTSQQINEKENTENQSVISKINLVFEPNSTQHYNLSISFNKTFQDLMQITQNKTDIEDNNLQHTLENDQINYFQSFLFYKKFSKKHIIRFFSNYQYKELTPVENWLADKKFLSDYIPWQTSDTYLLKQYKSLTQHNTNNLLKYYYKINNRNHLYFSLGDVYTYAGFDNSLSQKLNTAEEYLPDFFNDYTLKINDLYIGLQYRFKIGAHLFTPGLYAHYLYWKNSENKTVTSDYLLLPELNYEGKVLLGELAIKYGLKTNLPKTDQYTTHRVLKSYDQIFLGNPELTYELFHHLSFHYSFFSLRDKIMLFIHVDLKKYEAILKQKQTIVETNYYTTSVISNQPDQSFMLMINFNKEWQKWSVEYEPFVSLGKSYDFINNQWLDTQNTMFVNVLSLATDYIKFPEIKAGLSYSYYITENQLNKTTRQEIIPFVETKMTYKSITFQTDYKLQYIKDIDNFNSTNKLWNFSILYNKEDKPFGIAFEMKNILDQPYAYRYYTSSYLNTQQYTFVQPRLWMLKLHYKL